MPRRQFIDSLQSSLVIALATGWLLPQVPVAAQLTDLGAQLVLQCGAGQPCDDQDNFGGALVAGDFDGDGFDDLAVGVPGDTIAGVSGAGSVHVFFGSSRGLRFDTTQLLRQGAGGLGGAPEAGDHFGAALAAFDLNEDGFDDLVIGVPDEDLGSVVDAGMVVVVHGSATGLATTSNYAYLDVPAGTGDRYGASVAAYRNDNCSQPFIDVTMIAVGIPGRTVDLLNARAGAVETIRTPILCPTGAYPPAVRQLWHQNSFIVGQGGLEDDAEVDDFFGSAVALGRFEVNELAALAIGVPFEDLSGVSNTGGVSVLYRDTFDDSYFSLATDQFWHQNVTGVPGTNAVADRFGGALAAGDFDDDGNDELAIGGAGETVSGFAEAGAVWILTAEISHLSGAIELTQSDAQVNGSEPGDHFGAALVAGDFDGDGVQDLAVGAPDENIGTTSDCGRLNVFYGGASGLTTAGAQTFDQDFPANMPDGRENSDFFADALAAGDFDGNGVQDLAIGVPGEDVNTGGFDEGEVNVVYGLDRSIGAFGTVQFASPSAVFSEASATRFVVLTRSGSAVLAASVDHSRTGGSATPGVDFNYFGGSQSWGVGDLGFETFGIEVLGDTLDEPDETIVIQLSNPSPGTALGTPLTFTFTIQDDDVAGNLQFSASTYSVGEAAGAATITVTRTGGAASAVTVHYETFEAGGGSATPNQDYTPVSGTLTFGANQASQTFQVPILNDPNSEPNETIVLKLATPGGGGVLGSPTTATLTIVDDDPALPSIFSDGFESGNTGAWSSTTGGA